MRRPHRIPAWALVLALVVVAGAAWRADHAAHHGRFLSTDERAYAKLAIGLQTAGRYAGEGMRDPLHWPPGMPAFLAVARAAGGGAADDLDPAAVYWAQAVVGVGLILVVFLLARLLAGPWAGVAAAAGVAAYPPLSVITGDVVSEPLGALTLALALLAFAWAWRRGGRRPWRWALAGAVLGAAVLVRADLLVLPPVLAVIAGLSVRRVAAGGAYLAAAVLVLAPWSAYATHARHEVTPVTSSGWSSLFVGTYLPGDGGMTGLKRELGDEARRHNPKLRGMPDHRLRATWILDAVAARHPELSRNAALKRETLANLRRYALGRPAAFAALQLRKLERMWLGYDRGTHHNRRAWILAVHLLLAALGLLGLGAGLVRTRHPVLWAILATVVVATLVNAAFVSEARHNVRLMPLLLAGGAAGAALSRGRAGRTAPPPVPPAARPAGGAHSEAGAVAAP